MPELLAAPAGGIDGKPLAWDATAGLVDGSAAIGAAALAALNAETVEVPGFLLAAQTGAWATATSGATSTAAPATAFAGGQASKRLTYNAAIAAHAGWTATVPPAATHLDVQVEWCVNNASPSGNTRMAVWVATIAASGLIAVNAAGTVTQPITTAGYTKGAKQTTAASGNAAIKANTFPFTIPAGTARCLIVVEFDQTDAAYTNTDPLDLTMLRYAAS